MKNAIALRICLENICKNYNVPAEFLISEPLIERTFPDSFIVFVELNTLSSMNFGNKEINRISETGIKSNKDYRKLRFAARLKLIDAIRSLRDLTEESLRNLGAKV